MNKERWCTLMAALGFDANQKTYHELSDAYAEKHRFYHNAEHIKSMLQHFDDVYDLAERPAELELAIWFHDAIYKPFSKHNELKSAQWARNFALANGYTAPGATRIYNLIMATLHNGVVSENDQKLLVDIDLTILGTPSSVYDKFEQNVRLEYKRVPFFIYRKKRKALLQSFLINSHIYHFDYFKQRFEDAARENMNRSIQML